MTSTVRAAGMTSSMPASCDAAKRIVDAHHLGQRVVFGEKCARSEGQHSHLVKDRNSKPACSEPIGNGGASSAAPGVSLCRQIDVMPRSARATACGGGRGLVGQQRAGLAARDQRAVRRVATIGKALEAETSDPARHTPARWRCRCPAARATAADASNSRTALATASAWSS